MVLLSYFPWILVAMYLEETVYLQSSSTDLFRQYTLFVPPIVQNFTKISGQR